MAYAKEKLKKLLKYVFLLEELNFAFLLPSLSRTNQLNYPITFHPVLEIP